MRGEGRREKCISAQGSSAKGSSQQSSTSVPKVKGGGPLFSGWGPTMGGGGLVNDTTPAGEGNKEHILPFSTRSVVG